MSNTQNLVPANKRSKSEARENGKKGGIKSGESRRKKKALKSIAKSMMNVPIEGKARKELLKKGIDEDCLDSQWPLLIMGLTQKAIQKGDEKAFAKLQELTDEQTDKFLAMKEKELKLKERELILKEKELELKMNNGNDDGVVIIHDVDDLEEFNDEENN